MRPAVVRETSERWKLSGTTNGAASARRQSRHAVVNYCLCAWCGSEDSIRCHTRRQGLSGAVITAASTLLDRLQLDCLPLSASLPTGLVTYHSPRICVIIHSDSTANKIPHCIALLQLLVPSSPTPLAPPSLLLSLGSTLRHQLQSSPDTCDNARYRCCLPSPSTSPLSLLCDATQPQCLITTSSITKHLPLPRTIQAFHAAVSRSCGSTLAIFFERLDTFLKCRKHCSTSLVEQQPQQPREHHLDGTDFTSRYPHGSGGRGNGQLIFIISSSNPYRHMSCIAFCGIPKLTLAFPIHPQLRRLVESNSKRLSSSASTHQDQNRFMRYDDSDESDSDCDVDDHPYSRPPHSARQAPRAALQHSAHHHYQSESRGAGLMMSVSHDCYRALTQTN